jgi:hypothetical protein
MSRSVSEGTSEGVSCGSSDASRDGYNNNELAPIKIMVREQKADSRMVATKGFWAVGIHRRRDLSRASSRGQMATTVHGPTRRAQVLTSTGRVTTSLWCLVRILSTWSIFWEGPNPPERKISLRCCSAAERMLHWQCQGGLVRPILRGLPRSKWHMSPYRKSSSPWSPWRSLIACYVLAAQTRM